MNGIQLGNCGDTFNDAHDYFERSGSAYWLQMWQQTFDPDVHQLYSLPIDVPEPRTIMLIYALGNVREEGSGASGESFRDRQASYCLQIWKRGDYAPRIGETDTFLSKPETYGPVEFNRRIAAKQRLWYDTNVTKDILMKPGEGHVLSIQPHTALDLVIQIGGFT